MSTQRSATATGSLLVESKQGQKGWVIAEAIPDEALVVRGGRNLSTDIVRGTGMHPSGVTGVSVECAVGVSVAALAVAIPHGQIGVTTVGAVRRGVVM